MGVWGCRMGGTSEGLEAKKKEEKKERVTKELEKEEENNKKLYNVQRKKWREISQTAEGNRMKKFSLLSPTSNEPKNKEDKIKTAAKG